MVARRRPSEGRNNTTVPYPVSSQTPSALASRWGQRNTPCDGSVVVTTVLVVGSILTTAFCVATHIPSPEAATSTGPGPTGMVASTVLFVGSIRETVPSEKFDTHMEPNPGSAACGSAPT